MPTTDIGEAGAGNTGAPWQHLLDAYTKVGTWISSILAPLMLLGYWVKLKETIASIREHPVGFACSLAVFVLVFAWALREKGLSLSVIREVWRKRFRRVRSPAPRPRLRGLVIGVLGAAALAFVTAAVLLAGVSPKYYVRVATVRDRESGKVDADRIRKAVRNSGTPDLNPVRLSPLRHGKDRQFIVTVGGPHETMQAAETTLSVAKARLGPVIHPSAYVSKQHWVPVGDRLDLAWRALVGPLRSSPKALRSAAPDSGRAAVQPDTSSP